MVPAIATSSSYKSELIAMTVSRSFRGRHFTPNEGDYGFTFVRWTLNVIAGVVAILIISSAIFVSVVVSYTMEWWV